MPGNRQAQIVASVTPQTKEERLRALKNSRGKDFSGLTTTQNRGYDSRLLAYVNRALDSIPAIRRAPILAWFVEESGVNPNAIGDDGDARGIGQWYPDRFDINASGAKNIDYQLRYAMGTLAGDRRNGDWTHGGEGSGYSSALAAQQAFYNPNGDLESINHALNRGYVRPKGKNASAKNRLAVAEQIYKIIEDLNGGKIWKKQ